MNYELPAVVRASPELPSSANSAFELEYERALPALFAWVSLKARYTPRLSRDVEDVLQEVWLRAFEERVQFDPQRASFRNWIFGITRLVLLESMRPQRVRARGTLDSGHSELSQRADSVTTICRRLIREESIARLLEALDELDDDERTIVAYCGLEGRTCAQVAVVLGISEAAAGKRWQRLRHQLRDRLTALSLLD